MQKLFVQKMVLAVTGGATASFWLIDSFIYVWGRCPLVDGKKSTEIPMVQIALLFIGSDGFYLPANLIPYP